MKSFIAAVREYLLVRWWLSPLLLAVVAAAGWAGVSVAKPRYLRWQSHRATARARAYLAQNDLEHTGLELQVALRAPADLALSQVLADYLETAGLNQAVAARKIVCRYRPDDNDLKLDLARTALRFEDLSTAAETLATVPATARASAAYRRVEATYSLLAGESGPASRLLAALKAENPADEGLQLLDNSLLIKSGDQAVAERARRDLRRLCHHPAQRLAALRVLLADAMAHGDPLAQREIGTDLAATADASFGDLLAAATAQKAGNPSRGEDPRLAERLKTQATANLFATTHYGRWLLLQKGADAAAAWLAQLPPAQAQLPEITALHAEVAAARSDWDGLRRQIETGAWGEVNIPAVELAFSARIERDRQQSGLALRTWTEAIATAADTPRSLRVLDRLAEIWQWPEGMRQALFVTVRKFPADEAAAQRLIGLLRSRRDTHGLLEVLALRKGATDPTDRNLADWALVSLLVSPAQGANPATRALNELYHKHPDDPFVITNQAFALWQLGRFEDASALLDRLSTDDKLAPQRATFLAVIYGAAGRMEEARFALTLAPSAANLLPEEADLINRASVASIN